MEAKCLSVKTPFAYQICLGFKDVENRTWKTDYRGTIYIHSSGNRDLSGLKLDFYEKLKDHDELMNDLLKTHDKIFGKGHDFYEKLKATLKKEGVFEKYKYVVNWLQAFYDYEKFFERHYGEGFDSINLIDNNFNDGDYLLKSRAIIGKVDLVDIVKDSDSPFAEEGQYHWVLENPVIFDNPYRNVNGKLRLWDCSHIVNN